MVSWICCNKILLARVLLQEFGADYHQRWVAGGWNFTAVFNFSSLRFSKKTTVAKATTISSTSRSSVPSNWKQFSETIACDILEIVNLSRWWFEIFFLMFTPKIGEDAYFDEHIFQRGWNHQLVMNTSPLNTFLATSEVTGWRSWNRFQVACFWKQSNVSCVVGLQHFWWTIETPGDTPLNTNMSPENKWLEDVCPIELVLFRDTLLVFQSVVSCFVWKNLGDAKPVAVFPVTTMDDTACDI